MKRLRGYRKSTKLSPAFTRVELLACLGAGALLMAVILPTLANSTARSDRVLCLNNLRQIGLAYTQFGLEHEDRPPWRLPLSQGGNNNHPLKNNLYVQLSILSNSLQHPRLLSDPADLRRTKTIATRWDTSSNGGLLHAANQGNRALSYWIGIDGTFQFPRAVLAGDRNIFAYPNTVGCSSGISPAGEVRSSTVAWTNDVHGLSGNVAFFDGSVGQLDSEGLRKAFFASEVRLYGSSPLFHVLAPF